jgi:hypothetical protein
MCIGSKEASLYYTLLVMSVPPRVRRRTCYVRIVCINISISISVSPRIRVCTYHRSEIDSEAMKHYDRQCGMHEQGLPSSGSLALFAHIDHYLED